MSITQQDVDDFVEWSKTHLPNFEICFKDESPLQRFIGKLLWPINKSYMTAYTTVMFGKVYFPSREIIADWGPESVYKILRHEFVHLMDAKRFPILFELSYIFLLPAFVTMRAYWEWRGYTQNLIVEFEETGDISDETCEFIIQRFVNSDYGWMFPFPNWLRKRFARLRQKIIAGKIKGPYPYQAWGKENARI